MQCCPGMQHATTKDKSYELLRAWAQRSPCKTISRSFRTSFEFRRPLLSRRTTNESRIDLRDGKLPGTRIAFAAGAAPARPTAAASAAAPRRTLIEFAARIALICSNAAVTERSTRQNGKTKRPQPRPQPQGHRIWARKHVAYKLEACTTSHFLKSKRRSCNNTNTKCLNVFTRPNTEHHR